MVACEEIRPLYITYYYTEQYKYSVNVQYIIH